MLLAVREGLKPVGPAFDPEALLAANLVDGWVDATGGFDLATGGN
jgi:hypothetical protein